ncbi:pimeloyl-ACP methyl ester carboxylesterase [Litorimonas taeanensis]|uniref:Pimeloyl-ACP methyl ester carboxylesterase n=2 Tax=Litorimonas taeanensis TaxID=568099 RepID=A0A420WM14_9PROT|nr:pimeloyl-ACP methyl ester carboxylesterase [Litorimonas taeanensis]
MNKIRRAFVDADYGQMHYRIAGSPSDYAPLVCLHQSPKSSREFIEFMKQASNDRLVIAIDSPGHGESDVPETKMSIEGFARSIWSAIDALDLGSVDLLGHHTGAKVATEMAFQRPERVKTIVMVSALVLSVEERDQFKSQFQPIPLDEDGKRFSHMWTQAVKYRGPNVSLEQLAFSVAENLRAGEAYEWGHEAAFKYNEYFEDRISALPHRITVMNPNDMLFEYTPRVAKYLQNGAVVDYPDWGFGFMDTDTEKAVSEIKAALSDKPSKV